MIYRSRSWKCKRSEGGEGVFVNREHKGRDWWPNMRWRVGQLGDPCRPRRWIFHYYWKGDFDAASKEININPSISMYKSLNPKSIRLQSCCQVFLLNSCECSNFSCTMKYIMHECIELEYYKILKYDKWGADNKLLRT